jgi:hypothetical protein
MPVVVLVVALLGVVPHVSASVRMEHAGDVPFYARDIAAGEWTAIIFYRPPQCVPDDFDLLTFFDIPRACACRRVE